MWFIINDLPEFFSPNIDMIPILFLLLIISSNALSDNSKYNVSLLYYIKGIDWLDIELPEKVWFLNDDIISLC
jgi:hypothetical protein